MTEQRRLTEAEEGAFVIVRWWLMGGRVESPLKPGASTVYTFLLDGRKNLCTLAHNQDGEEKLLHFHGDMFYIAEVIAMAIGSEGVAAIGGNVALNTLNEPMRPYLKGKPYYGNLEGYLSDHPEGEGFRSWLSKYTVRMIFRGEGPHTGLPGGYLWAVDLPSRNAVLVKDSDDGAVIRFLGEGEGTEHVYNEIVNCISLYGSADMTFLVKEFNFEWDQ